MSSNLTNHIRRLRRKEPPAREDTAPHVIVRALAGTGKTTTLIEGLRVLKGYEPRVAPSLQQQVIWEAIAESQGKARSACFVAFNKSIATELQARVPEGCDAMTLHSMGFKAVTGSFGRVCVNSYRVQDIIAEILEIPIREIRKFDLLRATECLVSLCKANLIGVDSPYATPGEWADWLADLAAYYDVDLNGTAGRVFDLVPQVLSRCKDVAKDRRCDFDDMIWLPIVLSLPVHRYDLLLIDEAQDLNRCQQALAILAGRRLILCGDENQAIYGFAGADCESLHRMYTVLAATDRGCIQLPLTVTRRCDKAIVEEARKYVPEFEAHENNEEGFVCSMRFEQHVSDEDCPGSKDGSHFYNQVYGSGEPPKCLGCGCIAQESVNYRGFVEDGDMILCRVNAPLVQQCFRFLKDGIKAQIQGRDVGQGLVSIIKKLRASSTAELLGKLDDWQHTEEQKENAKRCPNHAKLISLQDRVDCITAFCEGETSIDLVIDKISRIFTNDSGNPGIKLSSVHKAKGLEADRVFLLQPKGSAMPHPMARTDWQRKQEYNLLYVAITRAKRELIYVS